MNRRHLIAAAATLVATSAVAQDAPRNLAVSCDPALAAVLVAIAAAYRQKSAVHVFIHPTQPALMLPQLERDVQNDILVARTDILAEATRIGMVTAPPPAGRWTNRLVLAGLRGSAGPRDKAGLAGKIAVPDPLPGQIDGAAILAHAGLHPDAILGAASTAEVAFLVTSGAARAGLLHLTELRADPRLELIQFVDDPAAPLRYDAAVTKLARRTAPEAFLAFLRGPEAAALLTASGLERVA